MFKRTVITTIFLPLFADTSPPFRDKVTLLFIPVHRSGIITRPEKQNVAEK